jgi:GNAT superfamily N-acetyltransferase
MSRAEKLALQHRCLREVGRWMAAASPGARLWEGDGITAAIVPATPQRSVVNSVVYESADALAARYDELAGAYERAGVRAWTVWVPEFDAEAIGLLTARGHAFDGQPAAMSIDLAGFDGPPEGELDWDDEATLEEFGEINDSAYGFPQGEGMAAAFAGIPADVDVRLYRARVDGETATVIATIDHEDDVSIHFVATRERFRGRGLASRLLAAALREGKRRGMRTSTLQASAMGEPVYARLGYGFYFRLHLYERRS